MIILLLNFKYIYIYIIINNIEKKNKINKIFFYDYFIIKF